MDQATALRGLREADISAQPQDDIRQLAEQHGDTPIGLVKIMLIPGSRPSP